MTGPYGIQILPGARDFFFSPKFSRRALGLFPGMGRCGGLKLPGREDEHSSVHLVARLRMNVAAPVHIPLCRGQGHLSFYRTHVLKKMCVNRRDGNCNVYISTVL